MNTEIGTWLEKRTGESRRQMALRLGQQPSTFNRNIETAEVVMAVCRSYGINPVEGLIAAEMLTDLEVEEAAGKQGLERVPEKALLEEVLRRVEERENDLLTAPIVLGDDGFPDYSAMSVEDARNYGLAAKEADEHIGFDELPNDSR